MRGRPYIQEINQETETVVNSFVSKQPQDRKRNIVGTDEQFRVQSLREARKRGGNCQSGKTQVAHRNFGVRSRREYLEVACHLISSGLAVLRNAGVRINPKSGRGFPPLERLLLESRSPARPTLHERCGISDRDWRARAGI